MATFAPANRDGGEKQVRHVHRHIELTAVPSRWKQRDGTKKKRVRES